jgi:hypothetical protein
MFERLPESIGNVFGYRVSGTVSREDVQEGVAELNAAIEQFGSVRILVDLEELPRPTPGAMWEDLKFMAGSLGKIDRMAVVGDRALEAAIARVAGAVTPVESRYFDRAATTEAWTWVRG